MVTLMLVLVWLISWTPYAMVFLLSATGYRHLISHHVDMLPGKIEPQISFTGTPFIVTAQPLPNSTQPQRELGVTR
jgi:hypothetical protein